MRARQFKFGRGIALRPRALVKSDATYNIHSPTQTYSTRHQCDFRSSRNTHACIAQLSLCPDLRKNQKVWHVAAEIPQNRLKLKQSSFLTRSACAISPTQSTTLTASPMTIL